MLDTTDLVILVLVTLATLAYFTKGKLWAKPLAMGYGYGGSGKATANGIGKPKKTRNIVERMDQQNKNVVVFFGSQTGTAGISLSPCGTSRIQHPTLRIRANLFRGLFFTSCQRRTFSLWSQHHDCRPRRV